MKKHAILFDWAISEINRLADSDQAEVYANSLSDADQSTFASLGDSMRSISVELANAKAARLHYSNWSLLTSYLRKYILEFPGFPDEKFKQFILHTLLAEKLIVTSLSIELEDVDTTQFEIRPLSEVIPHIWFVSENRTNYENSAAVFCCDDIDKLAHEVTNSNISPKLIYSFLVALQINTSDISNDRWALIKKSTPQEGGSEVEAYIHLLLLSAGKALHTPTEYTNTTNILNAELFKVGEGHQQWKDIHKVLSEYNCRKDTLLKFLTIYHVLENLMLKYPIVELERKQSGRMFSIREFTRLYKEVDEKEKVLLKKLIKLVFSMQTRGVTFGNHLSTIWKKLPTTQPVTSDQITNALHLLGINNDFTFFNNNSNGIELFTSLVYQVRCAIVHNKETEFHLTYATLNRTFLILIEHFLIPTLEEICFYLVGIKNEKVWYLNKQILLYE